MVEMECFCDTCQKTVPVKKVKITPNGKFLCYLECGHGAGYVFDAKLVHFLHLAEERSKNDVSYGC